MQILDGSAREGAVYSIKCDFTDENGADVVPVSAAWSLFDTAENIINSRDAVAMTALAATMYVSLSPADLDYDADSSRYFLLEWIPALPPCVTIFRPRHSPLAHLVQKKLRLFRVYEMC